jgi:hypothetical protein
MAIAVSALAISFSPTPSPPPLGYLVRFDYNESSEMFDFFANHVVVEGDYKL